MDLLDSLMHDLDMGNDKGFQTRLSASQKEEIRSLYLNGLPVVEIVQSFGCSTSNFWNVVRGLNVEIREGKFNKNLKRLELIPEAQRGWIAGIVDGEGYIGISRSTPRVQVSSTTKCMQDALLRLVGGHLYVQSRTGNERDLYSWQLWSAEAILPFLKTIKPYLVVKKDVALTVERFSERRLRGVFDSKLDEEDASLVRELNRKGKR